MSKLILIGAGPGDEDLITLKAIKKLQEADVVLYDALANESLVEYATKATVKKYVGKRYGCHALSQDEINATIVDYASKYKTIVRLKGGDPFVFGRSHEEITAATAAGMEVEVVPGITSAIAVPELAGIQLTLRGVAESFWVTTGTTRSGEISNDIRLAAASSATVVILMAMSKLEGIMDIFTQNGKAQTPVAIIQNGSTPQQKMVIGNVRDIVFRAQHEQMGNPAIIVVGEVVNHILNSKNSVGANSLKTAEKQRKA